MTKIIISILALVAAAALFIGYVQPTYDRVQAVQADVSEFNVALDKSRELQELKQGLLARYNTFSSQDLARLSRLLPDHVDNVRLVLDLDNLASQYGMAVQNVIVSGGSGSTNSTAGTVLGAIGANASSFDSLTLQFATRGTYENFVSFLQNLEGSLRIVDLVSLTMEPIRGVVAEGGEPLYQYNVAIRTYWLK